MASDQYPTPVPNMRAAGFDSYGAGPQFTVAQPDPSADLTNSILSGLLTSAAGGATMGPIGLALGAGQMGLDLLQYYGDRDKRKIEEEIMMQRLAEARRLGKRKADKFIYRPGMQNPTKQAGRVLASLIGAKGDTA